jgi:hypothetical protein
MAPLTDIDPRQPDAVPSNWEVVEDLLRGYSRKPRADLLIERSAST